MNYEKYFNKDVYNLKPSGIRKFFDIVAQMPDAISLGVGEPDFVTPWEIRSAAIKSIQKGYTAYTSNWGLKELRHEIADYLQSYFSLNYNGDNEVLVTIGASEAIDLSLRTLLSAGDEVIVPEPSYVSYSPNVVLAGGKPVAVATTPENGFKLTKQALEKAITKKTKLLIFPYPNNPTGNVMDKKEMQEIVDVVKKHDLIVLSDEIYAELTYNGRHTSIASFDGMRERTVVISGFSKAFAMTGWRIGYLAAPKEILEIIVKIHQYTIMCAPTASQYAALKALQIGKKDDYELVTEMRDSYNMRRRYFYKQLVSMGLECFEPQGAFYIFPSIKKTGLTSEEFAEKLLYSKKVAVVPGSAFGDSCSDFVRCCYACSMTTLVEACNRISAFLSELK